MKDFKVLVFCLLFFLLKLSMIHFFLAITEKIVLILKKRVEVAGIKDLHNKTLNYTLLEQ